MWLRLDSNSFLNSEAGPHTHCFSISSLCLILFFSLIFLNNNCNNYFSPSRPSTLWKLKPFQDLNFSFMAACSMQHTHGWSPVTLNWLIWFDLNWLTDWWTLRQEQPLPYFFLSISANNYEMKASWSWKCLLSKPKVENLPSIRQLHEAETCFPLPHPNFKNSRRLFPIQCY